MNVANVQLAFVFRHSANLADDIPATSANFSKLSHHDMTVFCSVNNTFCIADHHASASIHAEDSVVANANIPSFAIPACVAAPAILLLISNIPDSVAVDLFPNSTTASAMEFIWDIGVLVRFAICANAVAASSEVRFVDADILATDSTNLSISAIQTHN